jgi:hypothetical protein
LSTTTPPPSPRAKPSAAASKVFAAVGGEAAELRAEHARLGREHQVDGAGEHELGVAEGERLTAEVDRHQRGGAGGVDDEARAAQAEHVGHTIGDQVVGGAGGPVRAHAGEVGVAQVGPVVPHRAEVDAGAAAGEPARGDAGVLERLPGELEREALLRVELVGLARGDAEEQRLEAADVGQEGAAIGDRLAGAAGVAVVVAGGVPAVGGRAVGRVDAVGEQAPEGLEVGGLREAAGHADDRHRLGPGGSWRLRARRRGRRAAAEVGGELGDRRVLPQQGRGHRASELRRERGRQLHAEDGAEAEIEEPSAGIDARGFDTQRIHDPGADPVADILYCSTHRGGGT